MPKHLETAPVLDPNTMPIPQLEPDLEEGTRNTRSPGDQPAEQEAATEHIHGRHVSDALAARALQRTQRGTLYEPIAPAPTLSPPEPGSFYRMD